MQMGDHTGAATGREGAQEGTWKCEGNAVELININYP